MNFTPLPEQQLFTDHANRCGSAALFFVGMGIGKTAASLYTICEWLRDCRISAALIVAPLTVANVTWPDEVQCWDQFRWLKTADLRTDAGWKTYDRRGAHIYFINWEQLPNLAKRLKGKELHHDLVVYDELTKAKNPNSKRVRKYRALPRPPYSWGLTGTPMVSGKHLDLFGQVRLVDGGERLGENYMRYREHYFTKADYMGYKWELKEGAGNSIEERIADITLTMRSEDWLDIPQPVVNDIEVPISKEAQDQYREFEKHLILNLPAGPLTAANAAVLVTKLLQFTSGAVYNSNREVIPVHDEKLHALAKLYKDHRPLLVGTAFVHEQERIRRSFPDAEFFSDHQGKEAQQKLVERWNAGKVKMLVAHPASAGHGLNLQHGGCNIVWATLTYNNEHYMQFIKRLGRRGQLNQVTVHRLLVPDSADYIVAAALEDKHVSEQRLLSALTLLEKKYRK